MKKQKENSREGITWSEVGKQNVQAEKVYCLNCVHNCDDHTLLVLCVVRKLFQVPKQGQNKIQASYVRKYSKTSIILTIFESRS